MSEVQERKSISIQALFVHYGNKGDPCTQSFFGPALMYVQVLNVTMFDNTSPAVRPAEILKLQYEGVQVWINGHSLFQLHGGLDLGLLRWVILARQNATKSPVGFLANAHKYDETKHDLPNQLWYNERAFGGKMSPLPKRAAYRHAV